MTRGLAAALLLALLPAPLLAQEPSPSPSPSTSGTPPPLRLEVDVDLVSITAVVTDKEGRFVSGLGTKDVEVFEDGVKQEVSFFREARGGEHVPLSLVLVLDTSGSMIRTLSFLQEAALSLLSKMDEGDTALLVSFNDSVKASSEFSGDYDRLESYVSGLQAWGGTSLFDAVHYGLNRVRDQPGRKAVIVFSDGADTTSSMKEQEVTDYAKAVEATVYSVGFKGEGGFFARGPRGFLRGIARDTGGSFYDPSKVGDVLRTFSAIADELQHHYLLAYTPQRAPDGTFRTIQVKVKRPNTEVKVRTGYFSVKRKKRPVR